MRKADLERKTKETQIRVKIDLDGTGSSNIETPIPFFTHMLESVAKHSIFNVELFVKGDVKVDQHHTVEDTGIVLGKAVKEALGEKKGINRAGFFVFPMDESLSVVSVDIGGRPFLQFDAHFKRQFCGNMDLDTVEDFFLGFTQGLSANIAVRVLSGRSDHHKVESIFKAFAKAMAMAVSFDERLKDYIPSAKGVIE